MADKAGKEYWNNNWDKSKIPTLIDCSDQTLNSYVNNQFCKIFETVFSKYEDTKNVRILEVGCAKSVWLPYFKSKYGCEIWGIDYSDVGVELEKQVLKHYSITGEIRLADMFNPPKSLLNCFDIVFSFGVVEHFDDTTGAIFSLSRFLKKDGTLVTVVPNMHGITGFLQKGLNKDTYLKHVALDRESMHRAHVDNNFEIKFCDYFLPINLSVVNIENLSGTKKYKLILKIHSIISKLMWVVDRSIFRLKPNNLTSPYIVVIAEKG